jgi:hypothetical protein
MKPKKLLVTDIEQQLELMTTNVNNVREQINDKTVRTSVGMLISRNCVWTSPIIITLQDLSGAVNFDLNYALNRTKLLIWILISLLIGVRLYIYSRIRLEQRRGQVGPAAALRYCSGERLRVAQDQ